MKRDGFSFRAHFSKIGWTAFRNSGDVLWFEGVQLEALEFKSDQKKIKLEALNAKGEKLTGNQKVGTIGKAISLKAISLEDEEKECKFLYRVYLKKIGWTGLVKSGQLCGLADGSKESASIVIEGIQIICSWNDDMRKIEEAEQKLTAYENVKNGLFVVNKNKMLESATINYKKDETPGVVTVANGGVLPLQKIARSRNGIFLGGVCDEHNNFIAGFERKTNVQMNMSCLEGYVPENFAYSDEEVIYGGVLIGFFGHALTECTSRLWWILQNMENERKIVILKAPGTGDISTKFFELAGISTERLEFVEKPTRYKKVIVPQQAILLWEYVYPKEFLMPYNKIKERIGTEVEYKKIYLTRTHLKKQDGIHEEYFEDFFERRGYKILALEEYPIEQQIAIMKGAQEVVCTAGTLSHMTLFCNDGISLIIINRTTDHILVPQLIINQAKNFQVKWIDATFNFLPTAHVCGPSLYGPTKLFKKFLDDNDWDYEETEVSIDLSIYAFDYVQKWMEVYRNEKNFNEISGKDMYYVISGMYRALENEKLKVKYKTKLQDRIEKLTEENRQLKEKYES